METTTTSRFFTEQQWEGDDVSTVVVLGIIFAALLVFAIFKHCCSQPKNPRTVGVFAMAGSLVGRITLVLIMAEGSVFLAISSRGDNISEGDANEAALASVIFKYISWGLLLTIVVGDGICAPCCWFE